MAGLAAGRTARPTIRLTAGLMAGLTAGLLLVAGPARAADNYCGELANAYGPFDYRDAARAAELATVEGAHFTTSVALGVKGSTGQIGADLHYTLRAFPNHPPALAALDRVTLRDKVSQLPGAAYPTECYFERALRFAPDDGAARAAYANYFHARGQFDKALALLVQAAQLAPDNPSIHYNLGLAYARKKDFGAALIHARQAYALGFPLPGLRQMLVAAGQWDGAAP